MQEFLGFDHVDARVRSLGAVEAFYDRLMPRLGLSKKRHCLVEDDRWTEVSALERYTAIEYYEESAAGRASRFIGFIEDAGMQPVRTRIAFTVESPAIVLQWARELEEFGAIGVELSDEMNAYPAVFFSDPAGTLLEICARKAKS